MTTAAALPVVAVEATATSTPPHRALPVTAASVTAVKVAVAALLAGVTRCGRCGGARLRRCRAAGRYAVIICDDCNRVHVRDARDVSRAVRSVVDPAQLRKAIAS